MQSKTSFFNRTLFRKNLSRYWPLWGFASFVGFLAPAALLVQMLQSGSMSLEPLRSREIYYYLLSDAVPIVSLVYAILCAMAVWNYLYHPRSVGMMHSLPIRREGLFLTNLLSGLAMMAIPYLVAGGLGTLLFACCGGFDAWGTLATILAVIGQSVTFFGLATFCAFLTGNIFALPVLYFLLNFLAPLGDWLCNLFARGFLFGFTADYSGTVDFLCPMVYLTQRLYVNSEYETVRDSALEYQNRLTSVTLENAWLIAAYAAAGLVFLALAYLLYRRRESERAGDVVAVRVFRPVFRFGVAALSALLGGRLLYALLWESFQAGDTFTPVPLAICLIVAALIGYYAASMLLAKSLRVFRGSAVGALCLVAACAAFCAGMRYDLFGIERRIPDKSEITQLEIYLARNTYYLTPEEQPELLSGAQDLQRTLIAQKDLIRSNYVTYRHGSTSSDPNASTNIRYIYTLKNGATVEPSTRSPSPAPTCRCPAATPTPWMPTSTAPPCARPASAGATRSSTWRAAGSPSRRAATTSLSAPRSASGSSPPSPRTPRTATGAATTGLRTTGPPTPWTWASTSTGTSSTSTAPTTRATTASISPSAPR